MRRILLLVVAIVVLVALFFIFRPKSANSPPVTRTVSASTNGVTMKPASYTMTEGDTLVLKLHPTKNFELHIHGYNIPVELKAGHTKTVRIKLTISGGPFDMENEGTSAQLATLIVNPR